MIKNPRGVHQASHDPTSSMPQQYPVMGVHNAKYTKKADRAKRYPLPYSVPDRKPAFSERMNESRI